MKKTFKKGGIHPKAHKKTAGMEIQTVPMPKTLTLFLAQGIGAPAKSVVKAGDHVARYQLLAEAGGFVSVPLHSPANGIVKKIDKVRDAQGIMKDAIIIETDEDQQPTDFEKVDGNTIPEKVRNAGIVGLGGAAFPTAVKLTPPEGKTIDTVLINGAECEPWLTCDDRLMRENAKEVCRGAELIRQAVSAGKVIIGIEDNKPEAISAVRTALLEKQEVMGLKKKYPQGGEKQLIDACLRRQVPEGGLPADVGVVVDNVGTAFAVAKAVDEGLPLVERVVTVTGPDMTPGGNFRVPIGMSMAELLEYAGGLPENTGKIVAGGPMMGRAVSTPEAPITKGFSGLLCLPIDESKRHRSMPCIRCTKCVGVCPMGLEPYLLMTLAEFSEWDAMKTRHALSCIECGSCSYICPSYRPLLDYIKLGKSELRKKK